MVHDSTSSHKKIRMRFYNPPFINWNQTHLWDPNGPKRPYRVTLECSYNLCQHWLLIVWGSICARKLCRPNDHDYHLNSLLVCAEESSIWILGKATLIARGLTWEHLDLSWPHTKRISPFWIICRTEWPTFRSWCKKKVLWHQIVPNFAGCWWAWRTLMSTFVGNEFSFICFQKKQKVQV